MKALITPLLAVVLLSGCAGIEFNDYEKYTEALGDHSTAESDRIMEQSQSIAEVAENTETETKIESVLLSVIAMQQIASLKPVKLDIEKPTTGYDVLDTVAGHIPFVTSTVGMYKLGEAGIKAAGDIVVGDNANLNDSLNDTEVHATGDGNSSSASQTSDKSGELKEAADA